MLVYPSSMTVSNHALQVLADALRQNRSLVGSRWRHLSGWTADLGFTRTARRPPRHGRRPRARPDRRVSTLPGSGSWPTPPTRGGPAIRVPQRRRRLDPDTGRYRRLSDSQKQVTAAHARQRGPGQRANAQLKSWTILRRIRSCPGRATHLVKAVTVLIQTG